MSGVGGMATGLRDRCLAPCREARQKTWRRRIDEPLKRRGSDACWRRGNEAGAEAVRSKGGGLRQRSWRQRDAGAKVAVRQCGWWRDRRRGNEASAEAPNSEEAMWQRAWWRGAKAPTMRGMAAKRRGNEAWRRGVQDAPMQKMLAATPRCWSAERGDARRQCRAKETRQRGWRRGNEVGGEAAGPARRQRRANEPTQRMVAARRL